MTDREKMIIEYNKIKEKEFVPATRSNNTGIGKTFEDYVGIVENNKKGPDLFGYEIKSKRKKSKAFLTLYTSSPTGPEGANDYLKNTYGKQKDESLDMKSLHTSFFSTKFNSCRKQYSFRLINDVDDRKIKIGIYTYPQYELLDDSIYYSYEETETIIKTKLNKLFFVQADTKMEGEKEKFYFNKAIIYSETSLERFLELIDKGIIRYDIRMGTYKTGEKIGQTHDHGSGFRIKAENLPLLYNICDPVD